MSKCFYTRVNSHSSNTCALLLPFLLVSVSCISINPTYCAQATSDKLTLFRIFVSTYALIMALIDLANVQLIDSTVPMQPQHSHQHEYHRHGVVRRATVDRGSQVFALEGVCGQRKRFGTLDASGYYSSNLEPIGELGGFDGYLSDASEATSFGASTRQINPSTTIDNYHSNRRYLNRRISDTTGWAIDESAVEANPHTVHNIRFGRGSRASSGNESSSSESNRSSSRHSWAALGRRLSMKSPDIGRAFVNENNSLPHSLQRADGVQPLGGIRRRTSWLGSIKKRINRGDRKNGSGGGGDAETMRITDTFFEEDNGDRGTGAIVGTHLADYPLEKESLKSSASSLYPRLRSQPSLCNSARNTGDESSLYSAKDVAFVPDADNMAAIHSRAVSSTRKSHKWTVKRPQFMLPYRTNTAENAPYRVLRE